MTSLLSTDVQNPPHHKLWSFVLSVFYRQGGRGTKQRTVAVKSSAEAEFMNVQFRWSFWA